MQFPEREGLVAQVAENIRIEAARRGMNQSDLARALGRGHSTVQAKWYGSRQWQLGELENVAAALGVPVGRLLVVAPPTGLEPVTLWVTGSAAQAPDAEPVDSHDALILPFPTRQAVAS